MNIYIRIKAAGRKRDILERKPREMPEGMKTAGELIKVLVSQNVREYNNKEIDAPFFPALTQQEMEQGAYIGRIGFSDRRNEDRQDEEVAVTNALQCFQDGLFRLFINEEEASNPDSAIDLKEDDTITLIRLVMLAGRRW